MYFQPLLLSKHISKHVSSRCISIFKSTSRGYQHSCKRPKSFISIRISSDISSFDLIFRRSQWDHYHPIPLYLRKFLCLSTQTHYRYYCRGHYHYLWFFTLSIPLSLDWYWTLSLSLQLSLKQHYPARALRALGLLLADGASTLGRGKTFWRVN